MNDCDIMYFMFSRHFAREPVLGFCCQTRHKAACEAAVYSMRLEISDIETKNLLDKDNLRHCPTFADVSIMKKNVGDSFS